MSRLLKTAVALGAGALLAFSFASAANADAPDFTSGAVHVTHAQDAGHHGVWADLTFNRVVTASPTGDDSYTVTMTDTGSFAALAGAKSPRTGVDLAEAFTGDLTGTYQFAVTSATAPDGTGVRAMLDEQCTSTAGQARVCGNRPSNESYIKRYFGADAVVVPGAYTWTYTTCETWIDSSANHDGTDESAGEITGKTCAEPTGSPSASPSESTGGNPTTSPSASGSAAPTTSAGSSNGPSVSPSTTLALAGDSDTSGGLPVTGTPLALIVAGGVLLLGAGVALLLVMRRRRHQLA